VQIDNGLASFDCRIDDDHGSLANANVTVFQPADASAALTGAGYE
jgi:hypothetical protein